VEFARNPSKLNRQSDVTVLAKRVIAIALRCVADLEPAAIYIEDDWPVRFGWLTSGHPDVEREVILFLRELRLWRSVFVFEQHVPADIGWLLTSWTKAGIIPGLPDASLKEKGARP
jgi:hypothetical protein